MIINNSNFKIKEIPNNKYYIYAYYDKNHIPFYIGFGKKNRMIQHLYKRKCKDKQHLLFYNKLNKLIKNKEYFYYKKLRENLSKAEAKLVEQVLISLIGRRDLNKGTLCNLTDGGEGTSNTDITGEKIAIYDINTLKLIKTFRSINKASKFIGVSESTLRTAEYRHDRTGVPIKYYALRFKDFPEETFKYKKPIPRYDRYTKSIVAINGNNILKFNKVKDCAKYFNVNRKTISYRIKNNTITDEWIFKYDK